MKRGNSKAKRKQLAVVVEPVVRPLRERRIEELNTAVLCNKSPAWASGVLAAANLAGQTYNASSTHSHDLTDCILGKLNLISRIRRNPYRSNHAVRGDRKAGVPCTGVVGSLNQEDGK